MQITWNNRTKAQTVTWTYVDQNGAQHVGEPIGADNSHTEKIDATAEAVGFMGTFAGIIYVVIPQTPGGDVTAAADDQT